MGIHELLEQQEAALKKKDIPEARRLLQEMRAEIEKREAWHWLRANEPESYAQLLGKLEQAGESLSPSGRTEFRQLREVFEWCEQRGIALDELELSKHLHKYREASAHLNDLLGRDGPSDEERAERLREALKRIRSDGTRKATRQWARKPRKRHGEAPKA